MSHMLSIGGLMPLTGLPPRGGPDQPVPLRIWQIDLDRDHESEGAARPGEPPALAGLRALPALSACEEARAGRFRRPRDAARYRRQRRVLRALLGEACGREGTAIELREQVFGRPEAVGLGALDFNMSRSQGTGWIAFSEGGRVGIDGECLRPLPELDLLARSQLSPSELTAWLLLAEADRLSAFLRAWSRKEAVLKALGCGLGIDPALIEVGFGDEEGNAGFAPLVAIGPALLAAGAEAWPPVAGRTRAWAAVLAGVRVASLRAGPGPEAAVAVACLEGGS